jgi:peptide/nickel transport system substrate-binding protein
LNNPNSKTNNCGIWIPGQGPWCADPGSFSQYTYDATKVSDILTGDGYKMNNDTGIFEKNGQPLVITVSTTAGNVRRATTVSLLQQKALAAGIDLQSKTYYATDLFSNVGPKGDFQVALYAQGPIIDPTVTSLFSTSQIPTTANGFGGGNWDHWSNKQADALMQQSDQELDPTKRAALIQQIAALSASDLPMIPVDVLPNIAAWRTDKIGGVDPNDLSSPYGFFFGMDKWYVP